MVRLSRGFFEFSRKAVAGEWVSSNNFPSGAEGRRYFGAFAARLNRVRKNSERKENTAKDGMAGAKARLILLTLSARLKPCPCYRAPKLTFSASCEVVPFHDGFKLTHYRGV